MPTLETGLRGSLLLALLAAGCGSGSLSSGNNDGAPPVADDAAVDQVTPVTDAPIAGDADAACFNLYLSRGCGASAPAPMCVTSAHACISYACSCAGEVIVGCNNEQGAPYAFVYGRGGTTQPTPGSACDPAGCGQPECPWPPAAP